MKDLGFGQAAFEIRINPLREPRSTGLETVEFLFAANPGEPLKPLSAVASSGEISRVMLAAKTAFAQQDLIGLIFTLGSIAADGTGILFSLLILLVGSLMFFLAKRFAVRIGSASGEVDGLRHRSKAYAQKIVDAMNEAIIERG